ncbi:MAG: SDR family oxidoreductase [Paludibacteraceae bacterium]|nr:SDR family oxidoreductase [Paludibacteraceae bacterium]
MKTALITGATEGIGREFVSLFAADSYQLVLVARNEQKLKEICSQTPVPATYYACDLSDLKQAQSLLDSLEQRNMIPDCVVNCAGYGQSGEFTGLSWEQQANMLHLNVETLALFTHSFARQMKQRGSGIIMNVASIAAFTPIPHMAMYAATKAFVKSLSEAVDYEMMDYGVRVMTLCPGVTDTKFYARPGMTRSLLNAPLLHTATAHDVAVYGYRSLLKGKTTAVHGWQNRLSIFLSRFTPRRITVGVSARAASHAQKGAS